MESGQLCLTTTALSQALPMHVWVDRHGVILSAGRVLRRFIGTAGQLSEAFSQVRSEGRWSDSLVLPRGGGRVFLRLASDPALVLRGAAVVVEDGGQLLNLGFGIHLVDAVRRHGLTDLDFAPSDVAMEMLFLHEANAAMMAELSRSSLKLEEARRAAEVQAFTDPLTGLSNRRGFDLALGIAQRNGRAHGFALVQLDLDFFKQVNDLHGHGAGDAVLCDVARKLREATRADDTVARMGGDEFMLILPGLTEPAKIEALGRRIIDLVRQPVEVDGASCCVSASLGVALSTRYADPVPAKMLLDADQALYEAKARGRGQVIIHDGHPAAAS